MGAIIAAHSLLIRDYTVVPTAPPAPPAPPTAPSPPQVNPIAFGAVTRAGMFGIIGSAIASTTLATITCADAAMTIAQSETVAGLTFSYAAKVLSVAGTPTGSTRVQRVVISYISSDGNSTVRGSTAHEITLVSASEVLSIGSMFGVSGRVGFPLSATLASPTSNYACDVRGTASSLVPGLTAALTWTRGASSGSGTLNLSGTPTQGGTFSLVVNYTANGQSLGASTHAVVIVASYEAPAPTPAPAPAPSPPAPAPPPAPTPAPAPGLGPDPYLTQTRVLMRFDHHLVEVTLPIFNLNERGSVAVVNNVTMLDGGALAPGPVRTTPSVYNSAALFDGARAWVDLPVIAGSVVSGITGMANTPLAVECMVNIGEAAFNALNRPADFGQRMCPVIYLRGSDGEVIWALGFVSDRQVYNGFTYQSVVRSGFFMRNARGYASLTVGPVIILRPNRFVHLAGAIDYSQSGVGWDTLLGCWFDGVSSGLSAEKALKSNLRVIDENTYPMSLRIGGGAGYIQPYTAGNVAIVPFDGAVDEVRVTAGGRYADRLAFSAVYTITRDKLVLPWPNY